MANIKFVGSPVVLDTVGTYEFGDGGNEDVSTHVFQYVSNGGTISLLPQFKVRDTVGAQVYTNIPYVRRTLAGTASDDTVVIAALTADFTIKVDSTGGRVALNVTAVTGPFGKVYCSIVRGRAA